MRVAIVGLGGVGGYLGAMFAKNGIDVVGFARGEHLEAIQKQGITVIEDQTQWSVHLNAAELNAASGHFDVVLFCVKSYDLEASYKLIAQHIDTNSILLSFSNGVNNGDILRRLSNAVVLDGCVYILSHIEKPGIIRKKGKVFAAVFGGDAEATQKLATLFAQANLRCKTPNDIKTALWKKYIFIAAFATLSAYYEKSIGFIYEHHFEEAKALLEEIAAFAKEREGVDIYDEVEKSLQTASKVPYDSSTSMALDFKNKRKTELENLSGYVQKPLMQKLYNGLKKRG
jgi:2-dehydropantoate 2-reductase